ncbi:hypothetical protein D3C86_2170490 [compost metagenome]
MIKPEAIKAGISGIKTFASWRNASLKGARYCAFAWALFCLTIAAASADPGAEIRVRIASVTLAAAPGPTIN